MANNDNFFTCDVCDTRIDEHDIYVACYKCNFDVCSACLLTDAHGGAALADPKAKTHQYTNRDAFISWVQTWIPAGGSKRNAFEWLKNHKRHEFKRVTTEVRQQETQPAPVSVPTILALWDSEWIRSAGGDDEKLSKAELCAKLIAARAEMYAEATTVVDHAQKKRPSSPRDDCGSVEKCMYSGKCVSHTQSTCSCNCRKHEWMNSVSDEAALRHFTVRDDRLKAEKEKRAGLDNRKRKTTAPKVERVDGDDGPRPRKVVFHAAGGKK